MIAEIGHFALMLALVVALVQSILPMAGTARGNHSWMATAAPSAIVQFLCTDRVRAFRVGGRLPPNIATIPPNIARIRTHRTIDPSWFPQVDETL